MSEVVKSEGLEISAEQAGAWAQTNVGADEFRLSKILLMHGTSKLVKNRDHEAKEGDFRDSATGEYLGSIDEPMDFVPFHLEKVWDIERFDSQDGKWKWSGQEPFGPANNKRPISPGKKNRKEVTIGNERYSYFVAYNAYVLRTADLEAGMQKPYVVSFKNSSKSAGAKLANQMYNINRIEKLYPASYVMTLKVDEISNNDNTWLAFNVDKARKASDAEVMAAFKMSQLVQEFDRSVVEEQEESASVSNTVSDDVPF